MLVRERDDESLLIGQAAPRAWLEMGKRITVRRAPTSFGPVSFELEGQGHQLRARVELAGRRVPSALFVRFRHPELKPIRSVSVNGQNWTDFDPDREWVRIPAPTENLYTIITHHEP